MGCRKYDVDCNGDKENDLEYVYLLKVLVVKFWIVYKYVNDCIWYFLFGWWKVDEIVWDV